MISIHAPREGSDKPQFWIVEQKTDFNPRSPRGERQCRCLFGTTVSRFQSTLPARGATARRERAAAGAAISIHAPREGSDYNGFYIPNFLDSFQSTLPARGATMGAPRAEIVQSSFQSTLPARGATAGPRFDVHRRAISIHAPREGSDGLRRGPAAAEPGISIHAPREGSDSRCAQIYICRLVKLQ